jgi:hypothetical protein
LILKKETAMHKLTRFSALLAATLALVAGTAPALAHDDATMKLLKSANGGQLRMTGIYHFELVVDKNSKEPKDNPVLVYVTDHAGTKIPTAGATGTVTLLAGKLKSTATLQPDGDNRLKGIAKYASTPDLKAVVSITLANKQPEQARFTPLDAVQDSASEHKH